MVPDGMPAIAAMQFDDDGPLDPVLRGLVERLAGSGLKVVGSCQSEIPPAGQGLSTFALEDIRTGATFDISQHLGPAARGCRLDPNALAGYAGVLLAQLADGADALVLNRFGKAESEGGGLRSVIELAMGKAVPVLVAVRSKYWSDWQAFAGDLACEIAPDETAGLDWFAGAARVPVVAG